MRLDAGVYQMDDFKLPVIYPYSNGQFLISCGQAIILFFF